ncbi:MAG: hypothetical protein GTN89_02375, partial [Acidobacteria bacterium]|nr:hypothetical protein [Acidobacteriota bacterium]NIM61804.1 hypothetical protein [Acidobacteriota bacterium]NIO58215.1 hypothetical protein [Acidobacteriota bacterium]NIQ29232.1 hypothetical protein [Acidobacteriota bacterium]NIQ83809.1 hypothetical protein [Acidobacteriota bacterium]
RWSFDDLDPFGLAEDTTGNENTGVIVGAKLETADLIDLGGGECVNRTPEEVTGLEVYPGIECEYYSCPGPASFAKLRWLDPSPATMPYDIVTGLLSDLRTGGGAIVGECFADNTAGPYYDDMRPAPAPGEAYFYVIREQGPCVGGTYGTDSGLTPRTPDDVCP